METPNLLFELHGATARLTLNRPDAGNAIDVPLAKALLQAAIRCDDDAAIRCVVLSGAGRMFCAGGDVAAFAQAGDSVPLLIKEITTHLHAAIAHFARMRKPLIVAVNGAAAGAGLGLALLGDLVLAAQSAHFTAAYTAIGLAPDGGSSWLLPRLVGLRRAQELVLTNRRVSAAEALTLGMITRVVDDAVLAVESMVLAERLAVSATEALGLARGLLSSSFESSLETHLAAEARAIVEASRTPRGREGISAFIAKRKPDFR